MFTGLIEELGRVERWEAIGDAGRLTVHGPLVVSDAEHGDSISVNGVCLTVADQGVDWFTADVMGQTLAMSTITHWSIGEVVNLERAAAVGDRLGGHIVQGHIDGTTTVIDRREHSDWRVLRFTLDAAHAPLVVDKGSIAVDGVSLTVSAAGDDWFEVSLIPETLAATTLGRKDLGGTANIETDILARHVARLVRFGAHVDANAEATPMGALADERTLS